MVEHKGDIAGFISGYQKPDEQDVLFIWQVAVSPRFRGNGLAFRMLKELLEREALSEVKSVETTITEDNQASWALFKKLDAMNGNHGQVSTFWMKKPILKASTIQSFCIAFLSNNPQTIGIKNGLIMDIFKSRNPTYAHIQTIFQWYFAKRKVAG